MTRGKNRKVIYAVATKLTKPRAYLSFTHPQINHTDSTTKTPNREETGRLVFQDDFTPYDFNSNIKRIVEHLEVEWQYCHNNCFGKN